MKRILIGCLVVAAVIAAFMVGRATAPVGVAPERSIDSDSVAVILADADWVSRTYRFGAFLQGLNPVNLTEVLEIIETDPNALSRDEKRLFLYAWTGFDPGAAFEFSLFAREDEQLWMASAVIHAWAGRDPLGARNALLGIQETDIAPILEQRFVVGWIKAGGLAQAHDYVAGRPPSRRRELLISEIAQYLGNQDSQALIGWAEGVEGADARFRNTVFKKAAGSLAHYDPLRAMEWVASHFGEGRATGAAKLVALSRAESDPDAAFEWLASLPNGEEKSEAVGFVFAYWLKSDPAKAEAWLEETKPTQSLDPALRTMAVSAGGRNPAEGIEWARRIQDPGTRDRALVRVASAWYRKDPEAARRWLAISSLPKAAQKRVLGAGVLEPQETKAMSR